jgi:preprotein translocase subunit SecD
LTRNLTWKLVLIATVIVVFTIAIIPFGGREPIQLGLDLKGGTHLVMQVNTPDAIRAELDQAMERFKAQAVNMKLPTPTARRTGETGFLVSPPAAVPLNDYERIARDHFPDFSAAQTAQGLELTLQPAAVNSIQEQTVLQAIETIRNRIDALGVTEPIIARQGGLRGNRIVIQLPGVDDPMRVKEIIRTTAQLQFRMMEGTAAADPQTALNSVPPALRSEVDVLPADAQDAFGRVTGREYLAVLKTVPLTGRDLKTARVVKGQLGEPIIEFSLTPEGGQKFGTLTANNVGKRLAIVLDNKIQSAPVIKSRIDDQGIIEGSFTPQEANDLALVLRSGSLPASLTTLEERTVGPSLGRDSIFDGITASVIGFALVILSVVLYYRGAGINAVVALVLNLLILLGMMSYFGATLTLPGIAGIILTLAMAIDSNVLVFERIREELRAGKSVRAAIDSGFSLAFGTVIDTHLTTMIAALFLFQFGSGPVKGFAVTLLIGLSASVFTAFFVSRVIFDMVYGRAGARPQTISI